MKRDKSRNNNNKKKEEEEGVRKGRRSSSFQCYTCIPPPLSSPLLPFFVSFLVGRPPEKEKEKTGLNMQL